MVVSLLAASGAQATLFTRLGGKAVYDDVAKLTWLQDANYASSSGYDFDGQMYWAAAMAWADGLSIGGVDHWRLPGGPMVSIYNQKDSEMGNMFYNVLGGTAGSLITTTHNANYNLFKNVVPYYYWSGIDSTMRPGQAFNSDLAWYFNFAGGGQSNHSKGYYFNAWAVHDGDVGGNPVPAPVPAPGTLALLGAGLLGWAGVKRSRHRVGAVIG